MASLIVISWRDVPAQVVVKRGRETAKVQLSHRFQEAVDRAAMRAGRGSSDAYLEDWRRAAPQPCADELQAEAQAAFCALCRPRSEPMPPSLAISRRAPPEACTMVSRST